MSKALIYIIDDNQEFRESISWMLEDEGYQLQMYGDPEIALKQIEQTSVVCSRCCLLDIRMPKMNGPEFHDRLISANENIPVIYISGHGDIPLAVEVMNKGAITFLEKPLNKIILKKAINKALMKCQESNESDKQKITNDKIKMYNKRICKLTDRELEVLREIVSGKMNKVIAIDLGISVKTVELHRSRVMAKMEAKTPAHLVKMYLTKSVETC